MGQLESVQERRIGFVEDVGNIRRPALFRRSQYGEDRAGRLSVALGEIDSAWTRRRVGGDLDVEFQTCFNRWLRHSDGHTRTADGDFTNACHLGPTYGSYQS